MTKTPASRHGRQPRRRWHPVALVAGGVCLLTTSAAAVHFASARAPAGGHQAPVAACRPPEPAARTGRIAPLPQLVPEPAAMTAGRGWFTLTRRAGIVIAPGSAAARAVAEDLAGYLRPATGYPLPVRTGTPCQGDITLAFGSPAPGWPARWPRWRRPATRREW